MMENVDPCRAAALLTLTFAMRRITHCICGQRKEMNSLHSEKRSFHPSIFCVSLFPLYFFIALLGGLDYRLDTSTYIIKLSLQHTKLQTYEDFFGVQKVQFQDKRQLSLLSQVLGGLDGITDLEIGESAKKNSFEKKKNVRKMPLSIYRANLPPFLSFFLSLSIREQSPFVGRRNAAAADDYLKTVT